jgi:hypothetical protein
VVHSTVQRIHHAIDDGQMDKLWGTLRDEFADMAPFQVQLGPVWLGVTAVTVAVYPEDGMAELNGRVRTAMEKAQCRLTRKRSSGGGGGISILASSRLSGWRGGGEQLLVTQPAPQPVGVRARSR